jgi:hypothetical protein
MSRHRRLTAAAVVMGSMALLAQGSANARFQFQRSVEAVAAGPQRLDIDVALLAGAQPFTVTQRGERSVAAGGLIDLRLFSAASVEVPYLLVPPSADAPTFTTGRILPVAATEKTSGFEVDLGEQTEVDAVDLGRIGGPFLKRFMLEGSGDRERWTQLIAEGTAFDLPAEQLRHTRIEFQPGSYRYLRITWDDTNSGRVSPPDTALARRVTVSSPGPVLQAPLAVEPRPSEPGRSRFRITLPAGRLPVVALELNVGGGHLLRDARVLEAGLVGEEAQPQLIGQARLTRVVRDQVSADALRIPIRPPNEPQIDLVVDDSDNPALELKGVTAVFAELPWIYFDSQAGPLTARYGDSQLAAPRYDLEAARAAIPSTPSRARWRSEPPTTLAPEVEGLPMPESGSAIATTGFAYMRAIPAGPAGLISVPLDAAVMAHSGLAPRRLRDVRVIDRGGLQVPYLLEKRDEPLILDARVERRDLPSGIEGPPGRPTSYIVHIPFSELPSSRVVFTTRARVFQRPVTLGMVVPASGDRRPAHFARLDSATWTHADQSTAAPALAFSLPDSRRGEVFLLIEEGDNQPLPIEKATVLLPSYALRLFRRPDLPLRLIYGRDDIQAPRYDLQLLAPQLMGRRAEDVVPGSEQPFSPGAGQDTAPTVPPMVFWSALGLAVVVLLGLVVRLIRRDADAPS